MSFVTPWTGSLEEGVYEVEMPSNVLVGADTWNFVQWEDGSTNPLRTINLISDMNLNADFKLQAITAIEIHAFEDSVEVTADGLIMETGFTFQTPATIDVAPETYTIKLTYKGVTKEYSANPVEGETIRIDGQFALPTPTSPLNLGATILMGGLTYALTREPRSAVLLALVVGVVAGRLGRRG